MSEQKFKEKPVCTSMVSCEILEITIPNSSLVYHVPRSIFEKAGSKLIQDYPRGNWRIRVSCLAHLQNPIEHLSVFLKYLTITTPQVSPETVYLMNKFGINVHRSDLVMPLPWESLETVWLLCKDTGFTYMEKYFAELLKDQSHMDEVPSSILREFMTALLHFAGKTIQQSNTTPLN
jgi:hypothetical protein